MNAVVLVGGEGTRMRPLTESVPKPLIPFMDRPFLDHVLDHLAAHGVDEAILSSPYLEEEFRIFLEQRTGPPTLTWITEEEPLGTSGAIAGAREHLDDTFLVLNGDVLTDLDLSALVAFHEDRGAVGTIALTRVGDARPYGLVETDGDGRVLAFREKPTEAIPGTINAGTYVLEPSVLERVPPGVAVSIERETFPALIAGGEPLFAMAAEGYWRDLGTPEAYLAAHADALEGRIGSGYERPFVGEGARVSPTAEVAELVVIGSRSEVGAGARLDRSVLHAGVVIGPDAHVVDSILGTGASVGEGAFVRGSVIAGGAIVAPRAVLEGAKLSASAVAS